jgi:hypothetical protein
MVNEFDSFDAIVAIYYCLKMVYVNNLPNKQHFFLFILYCNKIIF